MTKVELEPVPQCPKMAAAPKFAALTSSCSMALDDNGSDCVGASTKAMTPTSSAAAHVKVPKTIKEEQVVGLSKNQKPTAATPTIGVVLSSAIATTTIPITNNVGLRVVLLEPTPKTTTTWTCAPQQTRCQIIMLPTLNKSFNIPVYPNNQRLNHHLHFHFVVY